MSTNVDTSDICGMPLPIEESPDINQFREMAERILDSLPPEMTAGLDNMVFLVEDSSPPEIGGQLLGMYSGLPITEKPYATSGELPDTITIYRQSHLHKVSSLDELAEEVRSTLIHEIGHYYGLSEERLHELGWA